MSSDSIHLTFSRIKMNKIKYIIFIQILAFFLLSCSTGSIKVYRDSFRNATLITMQQRLHSEERAWPMAPPYDMTITYMRTSVSLGTSTSVPTGADTERSRSENPVEAGKEKLHAYVRIGGLPAREWVLNIEGALKVDGETYPVKLTSRYSGIDDVHTFYNPSSRFLYTTATRMGSGGFDISDEVREKIAHCTRLALRFYAVDKVMTFSYSNKELAKLKEFLEAKAL